MRFPSLCRQREQAKRAKSPKNFSELVAVLAIFKTLRGDRACKALSLGEVAVAVRLRIAGFGEGTPQQVSREGQNRRIADFGTVVETCSK